MRNQNGAALADENNGLGCFSHAFELGDVRLRTCFPNTRQHRRPRPAHALRVERFELRQGVVQPLLRGRLIGSAGDDAIMSLERRQNQLRTSEPPRIGDVDNCAVRGGVRQEPTVCLDLCRNPISLGDENDEPMFLGLVCFGAALENRGVVFSRAGSARGICVDLRGEIAMATTQEQVGVEFALRNSELRENRRSRRVVGAAPEQRAKLRRFIAEAINWSQFVDRDGKLFSGASGRGRVRRRRSPVRRQTKRFVEEIDVERSTLGLRRPV
jgi:hypothetical protein